jgi:hypothetical protein
VQVLPFDFARAHSLYKTLFGPAEDLITGKSLLIVPSGSLTSLPFGALLTAPAKLSASPGLSDYRAAAWLGTRQPITILPSNASLQALRQLAKTSQAKALFRHWQSSARGLADDAGTHSARTRARANSLPEGNICGAHGNSGGAPTIKFRQSVPRSACDIEEVRGVTLGDR